jgi:hypothetical protein
MTFNADGWISSCIAQEVSLAKDADLEQSVELERGKKPHRPRANLSRRAVAESQSCEAPIDGALSSGSDHFAGIGTIDPTPEKPGLPHLTLTKGDRALRVSCLMYDVCFYSTDLISEWLSWSRPTHVLRSVVVRYIPLIIPGQSVLGNDLGSYGKLKIIISLYLELSSSIYIDIP